MTLEASLERNGHGALTLENDVQAAGATEGRFLEVHVPSLREKAHLFRLEHHTNEAATLWLQDELAAVEDHLGVQGQPVGTQAVLTKPIDVHQLRT